MTVRNALRTSSNRAAALVLTQVGLPRVMSYARQFGFNPPPYPSMVLGTGEVTVLHLTAAYAAFANSGRVPTPIAIRRVEDRYGTVIMQDLPSETQAISAVTAFQTAEMLAEVINSGSGYAVRRVGFKLPAGGKTGTTDDFRDAWFAGFTPDLVATVWVGFDDPQTIVREGFGGDLAAPIWGRFMSLGAKSRSGGWLSPPGGLVTARICKLSGLLANPECGAAVAADANGVVQSRSYVTNEYFRAGTAPTAFCNIHGVDEMSPCRPTSTSTARCTTSRGWAGRRPNRRRRRDLPLTVWSSPACWIFLWTSSPCRHRHRRRSGQLRRPGPSSPKPLLPSLRQQFLRRQSQRTRRRHRGWARSPRTSTRRSSSFQRLSRKARSLATAD